MQPTHEVSSRDQRAAALAAHLAEGYREGKVEAVDVLRVLRHELRRRNTNSKMKIARRSLEAQRVIDEYAQHGELPPKNGSADALHADYVFEINTDTLAGTVSTDGWLAELHRLREVVCVTAAENYRLMSAEKLGLWGNDKYQHAAVTFVG